MARGSSLNFRKGNVGVRQDRPKYDENRPFVLYRKPDRKGPLTEFTLWLSEEELEILADCVDDLLDEVDRRKHDQQAHPQDQDLGR